MSLWYTCGRWMRWFSFCSILLCFPRDINFHPKFLQIFKRYNPKCDKIKVALTDKDFIEIVAIEQEFPQAVNLLFQFHMLKYIRTKIPSYSSNQNFKKQLMQLSKKSCECIFWKPAKRIIREHWEIAIWFLSMHAKKLGKMQAYSWCTYEQKDLFTIFNSTTNWIKAYHRVLKFY